MNRVLERTREAADLSIREHLIRPRQYKDWVLLPLSVTPCLQVCFIHLKQSTPQSELYKQSIPQSELYNEL